MSCLSLSCLVPPAPFSCTKNYRVVVAKQKQKCLSEEEVVDVDEAEVADEVEEEVEEEALTWGHPQQVRLANTVARIGVLTNFIFPNMFFLLVLFPGVPIIQPCICLIAVVPLGIFLHACEDEMIYKSVNEKGKDFLFLFRATPKTPANFHALFIASSAIFQWICVS